MVNSIRIHFLLLLQQMTTELSNTNFLSDCPIIQKLMVSYWVTVTAFAELCFCLAILEENLLLHIL